jgi:CDP-diacylglycerol--glycerol-3-phosphate 3-phosphatidyltransferase
VFKALTVPNKITLSRIALVPWIVYFLTLNTSSADLFACLLFIIASITDLIDGYLARKHNAISAMGKLLDPLADKVLVTSVLVMMLHLERIHYLYVVVLISREFAVSSLRSIAAEQGVIIAASSLAKYKTATQLIALIFLILGAANQFFGINWLIIGQRMIILATVLSLFSAWQYFASFRFSSTPIPTQSSSKKVL